MKKNIKMIGITLVSLLLLVVCVHLFYIKPIRENALQEFKKLYEDDLEVMQQDYNLPDLNNSTYEEYYIATQNSELKYIDEDREEERANMLTFFDIYEDYFNFKGLKEFQNKSEGE